ncbi:hypothetical protein PFISCL1PPCAC_18206, partial [Pristionchus fissidentatus]
IDNWESPITCEPPWVLTYYFETITRRFERIECDRTGTWRGIFANTSLSPMQLVTGGSVTCEDESTEEDEEIEMHFLMDSKEQRMEVLVRRDAEVDYTTAIIAAAVVLLVVVLIIIVVFCVLLMYINPKKRPVGLPKGEDSQEPLAPAGESEMTMTRRLALVMSIVALTFA